MRLFTILALLGTTEAFFEQFFQGGERFGRQRQQPQQRESSHEERFLNKECKGYLCPDTQACVKKPMDCPCPFPNSQKKCIVGNSYLCISKGSRDCSELI